MADFEAVDIELNEYSDNWGPFVFQITSASSQTANDGLIPFGTTLVDVTVRVFVGTVRNGADLSAYTEVTDYVIDQDLLPTVVANNIRVYLCYPGESYKGKRMTLMFESTLSTGAKQAFFHHAVVIN